MKRSISIACVVGYLSVLSLALGAQQGEADGPRFVNGNNLVRPANYREWTFLSSSLGLTYTPPSAAQQAPSFGNVFVNPSSYKSFMQTGKWKFCREKACRSGL